VHINHSYYLAYKLFNALFAGLALGSVMSIYAPLKPSIYSLGGIVLALGMIIVARMYEKILTIQWFYRFTLLVEVVLFGVILFFLSTEFSYQSALLMYIGYQITFIFSSYLIRAETLFLSETYMLMRIDTVKQIGTLIGMAVAYVFYKFLEEKTNIEQVFTMHYILLAIQVIVIFLVARSFEDRQ
jgi:hypothetical protein